MAASVIPPHAFAPSPAYLAWLDEQCGLAATPPARPGWSMKSQLDERATLQRSSNAPAWLTPPLPKTPRGALL